MGVGVCVCWGSGGEWGVISQRIVEDPPLRSCGEENTPTSPTWLVVLFQFTRMHANTHTHISCQLCNIQVRVRMKLEYGWKRSLLVRFCVFKVSMFTK